MSEAQADEEVIDRKTALERAFDQSESGGSEEDSEEQVGSEEEEEESSDDEAEGGGDEEDEDSSGEDGESAEGEESDDEEDDESEGEDDEAGEDDDGRQSDDDEPGDTTASGRAPASWTPALREKWGKIPRDVRDQITKREREVAQVLGQSTAARRLQEDFQKVVGPFEGMIQAEGARHPLEAVHRLLQIGAGLRMGSQTQKSQILANLVKQYDIDVKTLDDALSGTLDPSKGNTEDIVNTAVNRALEPFKRQMGSQQTNTNNEISNEIKQFAEKNEFYEDVREDMADLMEMASRRGRSLTLQEAYEHACDQNKEIRNILDQRNRAKESRKNKGRKVRKKTAASSIRGKSSANATDETEPQTRRAALEAAFDRSTRRFSKRV